MTTSTPYRRFEAYQRAGKLPSANTIEVADINQRVMAQDGSERLLQALYRYYEKMGWRT